MLGEKIDGRKLNNVGKAEHVIVLLNSYTGQKVFALYYGASWDVNEVGRTLKIPSKGFSAWCKLMHYVPYVYNPEVLLVPANEEGDSYTVAVIESNSVKYNFTEKFLTEQDMMDYVKLTFEKSAYYTMYYAYGENQDGERVIISQVWIFDLGKLSDYIKVVMLVGDK